MAHHAAHNHASTQVGATNEGIDFSDLFFSIWQSKWLIGFATTFCILSGGYYAFVMVPPVYQSSSVVILEPKADKIVTFQNASAGLSGDTQEVNSELQILRARSLMHDVARHLNLFNDTEFNRTLTPPTAKVVLKSQIKQKLGWSAPPQHLSKQNFDKRTRDTVVTTLLRKTRVENLRQSNVFRITVRTKEAAKSALIADTIAQLYIQDQVDRKVETTAQATRWLESRVGELKVDLENAETEASNFSASTKLVSAESLQGLRHQIKALRERIVASQQAMMLTSLNAKNLEEAKDLETKIAAAQDDQLLEFAQNESQNSAFESRFETIKSQAISDHFQAQQQLETLKKSEVELSAQIAKQGQDLITLRQLNREAEASRLLYEHFLTRLKETASQQGIQSADSRVLSPAVIPFIPSEPRKALIVSMSAVLGLAGSLFFVVLKELRRTNYRSRNALERGVGIRSLARLPVLPPNRREDFVDYLNANPKSLFAHSIRMLRTNLLLAPAIKAHLITFTSAQPDEGCAAGAVALAFDLARLNKNVLLIDASQSDDNLHAFFGDEPTRGVSSILRDEHGIDQTLHRPDILGADVIFANDNSIEAGDLFLSEKFEPFISEVKDRYDFVIVNTPSISTSSTAVALLKFSDTVLMNVKWDSTTKQQVHAAIRILDLAEISVTGLVLSEVGHVSSKNYLAKWTVSRHLLRTPESLI